MTDHQIKPEAAMAAFARTRIREARGLANACIFPRELWEAMGDQGLLDPGKMASDGAFPDRCRVLTRAARAMAREGGCLGLTLSWMIHHLTAHYILGAAGPEAASMAARQALAGKLATGAATLSFAVSEPDGGGHPKFMSARAEKQGDAWVLYGEKTYLTNGPIAAAFVVIAVTGRKGGKKEFSAFLVDRNTPGLTVLPAMDIPFFLPSPHGGIRLDSCRVGHDAMVGEEGRAYPDLVLKFRQLEDALMTGAVTGAMECLLEGTAGSLTGDFRTDTDCLESLGRLGAASDAAGLLSEQVAAAVDLCHTGRGGHLFFRSLVAQFIRDLETFLNRENICLVHPGPGLLRDLKASAELGKTISRLRLQKLGRRLIRSRG